MTDELPLEKGLSLLAKSQQLIVSSLNLKEVLTFIVKACAELVKVPACHIQLLNEDQELVLAAASGAYKDSLEGFRTLKIGESFSGWIVAHGTPLIVPDATSDERNVHVHVMKKHGLKSFLGVPLKIRERVIGVLCVCTDQTRPFSNEEVQLVSNFASQAAIAIEKARLFEESEKRRQEAEASRRDLEMAMQIVQQSEARFQTIYDAISSGTVVWNREGKVIYANQAACKLLGQTLDQLQGKVPVDPEWHAVREDGSLLPPEEYPITVALRTGEPVRNAIMGICFAKSKKPHWILGSCEPILDAETGRVKEVVASFVDMTERKQATEKLRQQNEYLAVLHETTLALMNRLELRDLLGAVITRAGELIGTQHGYIHLFSPGGTEMIVGIGIYTQGVDYGVKPGKGLVGKVWQTGQPLVVDNYSTWPDRLPDPQLDKVHAQIGIPLKSGSEVVGMLGLAYLEEGRTFGEEEVALLSRFAELASIALDNARLYTAAQQELAERKRAEEALRESEERLQAILDNSPTIIYVKDTQYRYLLINRKYETLFPLIEDQIIGKTDYDLFPKEIADAFRAHDRQVLAARAPLEFEEVCLRDDGPHTYISIKFPLFDATGAPYGVCGISTDITERKRLEEQFRQSQKMEAVGRLAGGIAHDFNNLLTAIIGYSELLLRQIDDRDPLYKEIEEIKKAGERATSLTRQLLAFSRKQVLQPKVLNLNAVIADMDRMLRRLIEEDIDLATIPDPALGSVKADPGQIEQVIMNLAVNARDAMPQGGRLTIETANVELDETYARQHMGVTPGPYVMLAISDTGSGMDKETQTRLFEPFFTTKEQGKGTGLGLSTVYGIVKQSGGNIWVYSEPGYGTTFKVYLPRIEEPTESLRPGAAPVELSQVFETILVVEDDEVVRDLVCQILRDSGYTILEARHGEEALLRCEQYEGPIHLLMTDVVMPGMSGPELAERLAALHPETKVLYMSGYTDNAIVHHSVLDAGTAFLQKPFTPDILTRKVREALGVTPEKSQ